MLQDVDMLKQCLLLLPHLGHQLIAPLEVDERAVSLALSRSEPRTQRLAFAGIWRDHLLVRHRDTKGQTLDTIQ